MLWKEDKMPSNQGFKMNVKHEEIADAIKQGRDRVKGNQEILEYLGYIGVRGQNG